MRAFLSQISRLPAQSPRFVGETPQEGAQALAARVPEDSAPRTPRNGLQGIQVDPRSTRTQLGHNGPAHSDVSTERYDFDFPRWDDNPRPFNGRFQ